jgi:hypothetical protein
MASNLHRCALCHKEFKCEDREVTPNGVAMCTCYQHIRSSAVTTCFDTEELYPSKLVFWCGWDCYNSDNPEPSTESDEEEHEKKET